MDQQLKWKHKTIIQLEKMGKSNVKILYKIVIL